MKEKKIYNLNTNLAYFSNNSTEQLKLIDLIVNENILSIASHRAI